MRTYPAAVRTYKLAARSERSCEKMIESLLCSQIVSAGAIARELYSFTPSPREAGHLDDFGLMPTLLAAMVELSAVTFRQ